MNTFEPTRLNRWTMPKCYFGATWESYYGSGFGVTRDSSALERSNFEAAKRRLLPLATDLPDETDSVTVVEESHWACGWIQWIAIHETNTAALQLADDLQAGMEDYPVVDEELFSQFEDEECCETWEKCFDVQERIEYLRGHSFTSRGIASLMRAVRGDWYEAANMLHCPSDILH